MAIKTNNSAAPSYVDFDPSCDLHTEEGLETLIIILPDFKKNQLKVQVNKDGVLRVSGERPTNADGTKTCRFVKDTKIPESCDVNGIRAKFTEGRLHVMIPKKVTPTTPQVVQQPHPASTSPAPPLQAEEVTEDQKLKQPEATTNSDDHKTKDNNTSAENKTMAETRTSDDHVKGDHHMFEHGSIMQRLHLQGRRVALGVGVAVVTMVAIGAFVTS
ncbi:uncharacterized protein LOC110721158 [Chenopodium quinoa]|uniref:uncharacterized protein LOC110721158 n=1 Tax=Chenopodium quinoa TaxID=63459 RepID=UPI000B779B71|nr:uncharacterized protein LOC110721158 [Chenopodium quinoa]